MITKKKIGVFVIATMLVVGVIGAAVARAGSSTPPAGQATVQSGESQSDKDELKQKGPDTDNIQDQSGNQVEDGKPDSEEGKQKGPDTDNIQDEQTGGAEDSDAPATP